MATRNTRPPLKHTPFTELQPDGTQFVTNSWYDWALNLTKAIDTITTRVTVIEDDLDDPVGELQRLLKADVAVFAPQMLPTITGGCDSLLAIEFDPAKPNLVALPFQPNLDTSADFHEMLPFSWAGKTFSIWIYWGHGGSGTAWDVAWEVTSNATFDNESLVLDFLPGVLVTDTGGTAGNLYIARLSSIPIASYENEEGSLVSLRITRRGTYTEDTMDIPAYLLAVRFVLEDTVLVSPGPQDENFADVVLLMHGEGADGSTTFIDDSSSAHTISVVGTPIIETDTPKFGLSAMKFYGTSGYLNAGTSADWQFGSGDFTIEFFLGHFTWAGVGFETPIVGLWNPTTGISWLVTVSLSNRLTFYYVQGGSANFTNFSTSGMSGIGSAYKHFAITRSGTTLRIFFDGVIERTGTITGAIDSATGTPLCIGGTNYSGNLYLDGQLDELRITKGVARYTDAFDPPTAPFPDY